LAAPGQFPDFEPESLPAANLAQEQDEKLVTAVLARDRKATAEFVARYTDRIYSYVCSRLAPNIENAEDLVQEVFLAAWKGLASFQGECTLAAWLLGIARHKIQDYYRMRLREPDPLDEDFAEREEAMLLPEQERAVDEQRMRERTLRVLADLAEPYRLVLQWRYWERCSASEMAERTGKSPKAIERLLARARDQFRRKWQDG
jgi:RNA polymerase sigma-70 factor (ECF subfamily)